MKGGRKKPEENEVRLWSRRIWRIYTFWEITLCILSLNFCLCFSFNYLYFPQSYPYALTHRAQSLLSCSSFIIFSQTEEITVPNFIYPMSRLYQKVDSKPKQLLRKTVWSPVRGRNLVVGIKLIQGLGTVSFTAKFLWIQSDSWLQ